MTANDGQEAPVETLLDVLLTQAATHSARTALRFVADDGTISQVLTYGGLLQQAKSVSRALVTHAAFGDRVVLLCPPGLDFVTAFFGCQCAGMIAAPAAAPHPRRLDRDWPRLRTLLMDCGAAAIVTSGELREPLESACRRDPDLAAISVLAAEEFSASLANAPEWSMPNLTRDQLAMLQYTSGSTGMPRGVMISHGNLICNLQLIQQAFGTDPDTVGVFWLPFHHDMGLIGGILETLFCGGESTFFSPLAFVHRPLRWLQLISELRANISGGPNFAYEECVRRIPEASRRSLDLSSWELAFCGAEPIHAETLDRFVEAFAVAGFRRSAFFPCYGLAEATLMVTGGNRGRLAIVHAQHPLESMEANAAKTGSPLRVGCGFARPGQKVAIVSEETLLPCPDGHIGEIWVAGDSVGQGYWGQPEDSEQTFRALTANGEGPFLRTGDLGYLWNGELFVTGRLKDLIIIGGRNHYPQDIESTVHRCHPLLRRNGCVAFSIEADQQEQLVILAELEPRLWAQEVKAGDAAAQRTASAAINAIRRAVSDQHEITPAVIRLVPAFTIPRTSSGKVRRRPCREEFQQGRMPGVMDAKSQASG